MNHRQEASDEWRHHSPANVEGEVSLTDFGRATLAYAKYVELASRHWASMGHAIRAKSEAEDLRAAVEADRVKRKRQGEAREHLRDLVRDYVEKVKAKGSSLDAVLHAIGGMMRPLHDSRLFAENQ